MNIVIRAKILLSFVSAILQITGRIENSFSRKSSKILSVSKLIKNIIILYLEENYRFSPSIHKPFIEEENLIHP